MAVTYNNQEQLAVTTEIVNNRLAMSFEQKYFLFNIFMKADKKKTNQRGYRMVINTDPNPSISWRDEGGLLPPGGTSKDREMRAFHGRVAIGRRLTGDVLDSPEEYTLLDALTGGLQRDMETLKREINEQIFGDGTGVKAVVASGGGTATITFQEPMGSLFVYNGGRYQFINPADGAARSATASVVSDGGVDHGNKQAVFTANTPGAVASGDLLVWENSYLNCITGLQKLVSDDNNDFQGVSRSTNKTLKSPNKDASSAYLSLSLIDQQELQVGLRAGEIGAAKNHIYVTHVTQIHRYRELGRNFQMYKSGESFDGGNGSISGQTPNGRKIWDDVCCQNNRWYLLDTSQFYLLERRALSVLDRDGRRVRMIPGFTSAGEGSYYDQVMYHIDWQGEIALHEPQKQSCITNLATAGLVSPHFN